MTSIGLLRQEMKADIKDLFGPAIDQQNELDAPYGIPASIVKNNLKDVSIKYQGKAPRGVKVSKLAYEIAEEIFRDYGWEHSLEGNSRLYHPERYDPGVISVVDQTLF